MLEYCSINVIELAKKKAKIASITEGGLMDEKRKKTFYYMEKDQHQIRDVKQF